jgi:hypothetical protein
MPTNPVIKKADPIGLGVCSQAFIESLIGPPDRAIQDGLQARSWLYPLRSERYREWGHESAFVLALSMPVCGQQCHRNQRLRCRPCARRRAVRRRGGGDRGGGRGGDGPGGGDGAPARCLQSVPRPHPGIASPFACLKGRNHA